MLSRARYYVTRMRDAGIAATARTIAVRLAPFVWAPAYVLPAGPRNSSDVLPRIDALGMDLRAGLVRQARDHASYQLRAEARARRALTRKWRVLGYGETNIPGGEGWYVDPFHEYKWAPRYFPLVDFVASGSHCDVKTVWELSRLQYLVWLAEGAILVPSIRSECLELFAGIANDWIAFNPPGKGVNWTCAMEVALRGINLMLAASLVADLLDSGTRERIAASLVAHYRFLRRFPEISDVPGNHYLTDLLGEIVLSIVAGSRDAFRRHLQALAEEADRQFEEEGCHIERAPAYHRLCTDMAALAAAVAVRELGAMPGALLNVLERAIHFARMVADSEGHLPVIGDCDSGQILEFGGSARDISGLLALTGLWDEDSLPDQAVWLRAIMGEKGDLDIPVHALATVERRSGFLSGRCGAATVVMRVGAQGLAGRAAHDHDDAQSIWLSCGGRDIIVDRGCHSYTLDPRIRKSNIGSRAHNVLQPVDSDRFEGRLGSIGATMRGAPTCSLANITSTEGSLQLTATIDRAGPITDVTRTLRLSPDGDVYKLCVVDAWSSTEPTELRWHFGPDIIPRIHEGKTILFDPESPVQSLVVASQELLRLELFDFDFSPVYGQTLHCIGVRALLAAPTGGSHVGRVESYFVFASADSVIARNLTATSSISNIIHH